MENLAETIIVICMLGLSITAIVTSSILDRCILEPRPKRDITIHSTVWPLTLPAYCFNESGKKVRRVALRIAVFFISAAIVTLTVVGILLFLLIRNQ